jgi:hypothetical protein
MLNETSKFFRVLFIVRKPVRFAKPPRLMKSAQLPRNFYVRGMVDIDNIQFVRRCQRPHLAAFEILLPVDRIAKRSKIGAERLEFILTCVVSLLQNLFVVLCLGKLVEKKIFLVARMKEKTEPRVRMKLLKPILARKMPAKGVIRELSKLLSEYSTPPPRFENAVLDEAPVMSKGVFHV